MLAAVLARIPYETCPLCDGRDFAEEAIASVVENPLYKPELPPTQRWLRCRACTHVFVDGYLSEEARALLFAEAHPHQAFDHDFEAARLLSARTIESVRAVRQRADGRWLDVGFGNGSLVTTAAELGFEAVGIDLRAANVDALRAAGFEAHAVELIAHRPDDRYDVISLVDVLEHMPFPKPALVHAWSLLRDDGVLFLSMPNLDAHVWTTLTKRGLNPYWAELEHCHTFGRKRLERLLEECGFEPVRYAVSPRYRACMELIARKRPRRVEGDALRVNLGCGRTPLDGWVNVDAVALPGVDVVVDLERGRLPFADSSVAEFHASHLIEHIENGLALMQELHRVAKPDALATFRCPYGATDEADEDPTHVRRYFWKSWGYFSQPFYWRADYGYRGDWRVEEVVLIVGREHAGKSWAEMFQLVQRERNVVTEMVAKLRAVKPIREPKRELQKEMLVRFETPS